MPLPSRPATSAIRPSGVRTVGKSTRGRRRTPGSKRFARRRTRAETVPASVVAERALGAARAVQDELVVDAERGAPALLVGRQPRPLALGALRDLSDVLGSHES